MIKEFGQTFEPVLSSGTETQTSTGDSATRQKQNLNPFKLALHASTEPLHLDLLARSHGHQSFSQPALF